MYIIASDCYSLCVCLCVCELMVPSHTKNLIFHINTIFQMEVRGKAKRRPNQPNPTTNQRNHNRKITTVRTIQCQWQYCRQECTSHQQRGTGNDTNADTRTQTVGN